MENKKILGLIGLASKAGKIAFGTDMSIEAIKKHKANLVIVAKDASERTRTKIQTICESYNTKCIELFDIDTLSKAIGKNNKAIIAINDLNFSSEINKIINGGDIIG